MGRAFPELTMVSFGIGGTSAAPMVVCDEKGNLLVIESINNQWAETLARTATVATGLFTQMSIYVMSGNDVKHLALRDTVSLIEKIGECLINANKLKNNPVDTLIKITRGFRLFDGKIVDVRRDLTTGFIRGQAQFDGIEDWTGHSFSIDFQNENLVALRDEKVVATSPDLIAVLDRDRGTPILTEGLKYGQRLTVIGMPCDPFWRTEKALQYVGPRYFKYDLDYVPVEILAAGDTGEKK
jgi:DUF917 family protein